MTTFEHTPAMTRRVRWLIAGVDLYRAIVVAIAATIFGWPAAAAVVGLFAVERLLRPLLHALAEYRAEGDDRSPRDPR